MKIFKLSTLLLICSITLVSWTTNIQPNFSLKVDYSITTSDKGNSIEIRILNGTGPYNIFLTGGETKIELLNQKSKLIIPAIKHGEYALVCQDKDKNLFFAKVTID